MYEKMLARLKSNEAAKPVSEILGEVLDGLVQFSSFLSNKSVRVARVFGSTTRLHTGCGDEGASSSITLKISIGEFPVERQICSKLMRKSSSI